MNWNWRLIRGFIWRSGAAGTCMNHHEIDLLEVCDDDDDDAADWWFMNEFSNEMIIYYEVIHHEGRLLRASWKTCCWLCSTILRAASRWGLIFYQRPSQCSQHYLSIGLPPVKLITEPKSVVKLDAPSRICLPLCHWIYVFVSLLTSTVYLLWRALSFRHNYMGMQMIQPRIDNVLLESERRAWHTSLRDCSVPVVISGTWCSQGAI